MIRYLARSPFGLRLALVVAVVVSAIPASSSAQQSTESEIYIEDEMPSATGWWPRFDHIKGLGVRGADFDNDGFVDVVIGGNGAPPYGVPVRIEYLEVNAGTVSTVNMEILEYPFPVGSTTVQKVTNYYAQAFSNTVNCYGVETGDFDEDGWEDIAVGRRNGYGYKNSGQRDTVWLNDKTASGWNSREFFDTATIVPLQPVNQTDETVSPATLETGETFGIEKTDVDEDGNFDLVTVGSTGIRLYMGDGAGGFTHVHTFIEKDSGGAPTIGVYRNHAFADLDGDQDIDMFVVRGSAESDRTWFNLKNETSGPITNGAWYALKKPAMASVPPALVRGTRCPILWRMTSSAPQVCASLPTPPEFDFDSSFDCDLGDLDGDGDKDLVVASTSNNNVAYYNNGKGEFGSKNRAIVPQDGHVAYEFITPTPDWPDATGGYHTSESLAYLLFTPDGQQEPVLPCEHSTSLTIYEFRVPGKAIDYTTSVRMADINSDGMLDVAFANRNDLEDLAYMVQSKFIASVPGATNTMSTNASPFQYFASGAPGPNVPDYLYFGKKLAAPATGLAFCDVIEEIGVPCDGTSYLEWITVSPSINPDWIESNFGNQYLVLETIGEHIDVRTNWFNQFLPPYHEPYENPHWFNTAVFTKKGPLFVSLTPFCPNP